MSRVRLPHRPGLLAAALAAAALFAACSQDATDPAPGAGEGTRRPLTTTAAPASPSPGEVVVAAAGKTLEAGSGSFEVRKTTRIFGRAGDVVFSGQFTREPPTGRTAVATHGPLFTELLAATVGDPPAGGGRAGGPLFEFRVDARHAYMRAAPTGDAADSWVRMSLAEATTLLSRRLGGPVPFAIVITPHVPILELVAAADPAGVRPTPVPPSRDGEPAGYLVPIEAVALAAETVSNAAWQQLVDDGVTGRDLGDPIPLQVTITEDGSVGAIAVDLTDLLRRIAALDIAPAELSPVAGQMEVELALRLEDLGESVDIEVPPDAAITDYTPDPDPGTAAVGDCLPNGTVDVIDLFAPAVTIGCERPHLGEIFGVLTASAPDGAFPGEVAMTSEADSRCFALLFDYLGGPNTLVAAKFTEVSPTEQSWRFGDRTILCVLVTDEPRRESLRSAASGFGPVSVFDLDPATCFADDELLTETQAEPVSCDRPHRYEVLSRHEVAGTTYPGDDTVLAAAVVACEGDPVAAALDGDATATWLRPNETTWAFGDRTVFCIAEFATPHTGSVFAD